MSQLGIFSSVAVVAFFLVIGGVAANYFVPKKTRSRKSRSPELWST